MIDRIFRGLRPRKPAKPAAPAVPLTSLRGKELLGRICPEKPHEKQILVGSLAVKYPRPILSFAQLQALGVGSIFIKRRHRSYYFAPEEMDELGKRLYIPRLAREDPFKHYAGVSQALYGHSRSYGASEVRKSHPTYPMAREIVFGGVIVPVEAYRSGPTLLEHLGVRPEMGLGTAEVCLAGQESFAKYAEVNRLGAGLYGVFNPTCSGERIRSSEGELIMKFEHRVALVPDDVNAEVVLHELLHDVFCSMPADRQRALLSLVWQQVSAGRDLMFFQEVADRCSVKINLRAFVAGREVYAVLFANEVFAYAGTMTAGYETEFKAAVPESLQTWFKEKILIPGFNAGDKLF